MIGQSITPIVIDTDNALGGHSKNFLPGDVDDAFALAYLIKSVAIDRIYSVGGNANAKDCHQNNIELCQLAEADIECLQGLNKKELSDQKKLVLPPSGLTYLSLGPLTNLSYFMKHNFSPEHLWMTLGRIKTSGAFPPLWPMEFNATKDLESFLFVFQSKVRKTIVPLDVAIQLRFRHEFSNELAQTKLGQHLVSNIKNWQLRNRLLKGKSDFPVWDLVSAMALTHPETCTIKKGKGYLYKNGLLLCDVENNPQSHHDRRKAIYSDNIEIVTAVNQDMIWNVFFKALRNP